MATLGSAWALGLERSALLRGLLRRRLIVLAFAALGAALLEVHTSGPSSDGPYFATAGRHLLSTGGLHVYAARGLQAGPLQIGGFGVLAWLTSAVHLPEDSTYAVISTLASTALIVGGVRALRGHVGLAASATAELTVGLLAVGWLLATAVYTSGHPAELVIPALWIAAAALAANNRAGLAGVLIGLGAGFETWGLLGVAVLLLSGRMSAVLRALASTAGVVTALYLPFVVAGPFRMGQAVWDIAPGSLVHALDPNLASFPWSARVIQSVVVVAIGALAWLAARRSPAGIVTMAWFVPAALAMAKAISEPSGYDWYWLPVEITLLAGCACADGLSRRVVVAVVAAEVVAVTVPLRTWPVAVVALAVLLAAGWHGGGVRRTPVRRPVQGLSAAA